MNTTKQYKILIVAESIDIEDSSGSKANVALIVNLKRAGFDLLVYHYTRKDVHLNDVKCIAIKERKFNLFFFLSRLQRKLQHGLKINLAKYLEPIFGFSFTFYNDIRSITAALKKEKTFEPDIVLTLSKGASFRPHYALLNMPNLHNKWMAYIHDPYPFHYYPEPYKWSEPGYSFKIKFFKKVSEKCQWAAFPSQLLADWMVKFYPEFEIKKVIIPHQMLRKKNNTNLLPEFFKKEKFTLLHAGNLLSGRPPENLIDAFKRFIEKNPEAEDDAQLLFIGPISDNLKSIKNQIYKSRCIYMSKGYLDYSIVQQMQKSTAVNIILESKGDFSPFLPAKFSNCIEAGKPILVLGPQKSEVLRLLGEDYPYHASVEDTEKIGKVIEELYYIWKTSDINKRIDYKHLINYLSSENLKNVIQQVIHQ